MIDTCPKCGVDIEYDSSTRKTTIACWNCGTRGRIIKIVEKVILWDENCQCRPKRKSQ